MFGMKKKPVTVDTTAQPATPQTLEVGKEITFKDPKSGEFVYQRAITPENRKNIVNAMARNQTCAQQSIQMFMALMGWLENATKLKNEVMTTEKGINEEVQKVRDQFKLDRRWALNPALMVLERRDAPEI